MKKVLLGTALIMSVLTAPPAFAASFVCKNCSTSLVQLLEKAQSADQLKTMLKELEESATQTTQQIRMVQQNVEQYANMLQNTAQLPANLQKQLKGDLTRLASLTGALNTNRGDITSLGQIYSEVFPDQAAFEGITSEQYKNHWDTWSDNVDRASKATFQLSGSQLNDLQKSPEQFENYLDNLLSSPTGQMQAIQAGNQLAAVQIQESRELRSLLATSIQSDLQSQMKKEKEDQAMQEIWRELTKTKEVRQDKLKF